MVLKCDQCGRFTHELTPVWGPIQSSGVDHEVCSRCQDDDVDSRAFELANLLASGYHDDVKRYLADLGRRDPESGHSLEDSFLRAILTLIVEHADAPALLASEALYVTNSEFPRHCA